MRLNVPNDLRYLHPSFHAWTSLLLVQTRRHLRNAVHQEAGFTPEAGMLAAMTAIEGVSSVETQT